MTASPIHSRRPALAGGATVLMRVFLTCRRSLGVRDGTVEESPFAFFPCMSQLVTKPPPLDSRLPPELNTGAAPLPSKGKSPVPAPQGSGSERPGRSQRQVPCPGEPLPPLRTPRGLARRHLVAGAAEPDDLWREVGGRGCPRPDVEAQREQEELPAFVVLPVQRECARQRQRRSRLERD